MAMGGGERDDGTARGRKKTPLSEWISIGFFTAAMLAMAASLWVVVWAVWRRSDAPATAAMSFVPLYVVAIAFSISVIIRPDRRRFQWLAWVGGVYLLVLVLDLLLGLTRR